MIRNKHLILIVVVLLGVINPIISNASDLSLTDLLSKSRLHCSYEPIRNLLILSGYGRTLVFRPGESWGVLDYNQLFFLGPSYNRDGGVFFSEEAVESLTQLFGRKDEGGHRIAAVIIDPGHGGKDPGANHTHTAEGKQFRVVEKDIVLSVSLALHQQLTAFYPDKNIILTRNDDTYLTLEERTEIANKISLKPNEAMIFISIHANASLNTKASGFEVWYLPPDYRRDILDVSTLDESAKELVYILNTMLEEEITVESIILAKEILQGMAGSIGGISENRGLKEQPWFVVRRAKMPSVLVEIGFLTNPAEAIRLSDPLYLKKVTEGLYNGIRGFIDSFESTSGFTEQ